ncbi:hypothetical protein TVAG_246130 [Trichomonas vaginalis G3]|uniref:Uncharacterized protein n=1 Tax=Trichomonas vaginalis (strain ATCC PRA-98 / G3) TaxID=412133 RepID=A2E4R9_TRIV3|nr:hypothetical protein TVAGG3_0862790 [Trichomonas vaginalis G3]EAY12379.1 hypothetical protein TVAG_246130 [Trichomonas vaginalis G3]KAI5500797.1 hypothetical protein TVAGG3_0862790 [Trichomonas vaginalis G3]|eukprot:XP_001324602.1 hypothetical protein [Trichomonas vaginalis G3]
MIPKSGKPDPLLDDIQDLIANKHTSPDVIDVSEEIQYLESLKEKSSKKSHEKSQLKEKLKETESMNKKLSEILNKYGIDLEGKQSLKPKSIQSVSIIERYCDDDTSTISSEEIKNKVHKSEIKFQTLPDIDIEESNRTTVDTNTQIADLNQLKELHLTTESRVLFSNQGISKDLNNESLSPKKETQIHLTNSIDHSADYSAESSYSQSYSYEYTDNQLQNQDDSSSFSETKNSNRMKYISEKTQQILDQINAQIKKSGCCKENKKCKCQQEMNTSKNTTDKKNVRQFDANKNDQIGNEKNKFVQANNKFSNRYQSMSTSESMLSLSRSDQYSASNQTPSLPLHKNQAITKQHQEEVKVPEEKTYFNQVSKNSISSENVNSSLGDDHSDSGSAHLSNNFNHEIKNNISGKSDSDEEEEESIDTETISDYSDSSDSDFDHFPKKADFQSYLEKNLLIIKECLKGTSQQSTLMEYIKLTQSDYLSKQKYFDKSDACCMIEIAAKHIISSRLRK